MARLHTVVVQAFAVYLSAYTHVSSATNCDCRVQVGVTAVLTASPTDVLSHVAIRARSQGVLLATCFDEAQLEALKVDVSNWGCLACAVCFKPAAPPQRHPAEQRTAARLSWLVNKMVRRCGLICLLQCKRAILPLCTTCVSENTAQCCCRH